VAGEFSPRLGVLVDVGPDGTVQLPPDMMSAANIKPGGKVEVFANMAGLVMRAVDGVCDLCGASGTIRVLRNGKSVCYDCLDELRSLVDQPKIQRR